MDFSGPAGDRRDGGLHHDRRRTGQAPVELADAGAVRMARNHVLAGFRTAGPVPDPVRTFRSRPWGSSLRSLAAERLALGANAAGGGREVAPLAPATRGRATSTD